ncbi:hypothetical protein LPJ57_008258, partial [Coemansia sp. RSA 486]
AVREDLVTEKHWVSIVNANMPKEKAGKDNAQSLDSKVVDGGFSKRVLGEVRTLMWHPAASVEQYIVESITNINADEM